MSIFNTIQRDYNILPIDSNLILECYEYVDYVFQNKPGVPVDNVNTTIEKFKIPTWDDIKNNYKPDIQQQEELPTFKKIEFNNKPQFKFYADIISDK